MSQIKSTAAILAKALFRKKRKSESYFKYILFLLHLWLGLTVGIVICFVAITGALYVFKSEIEDSSAYKAIHRHTQTKYQVATSDLIASFQKEYNRMPTRITIPENTKYNIRMEAYEKGKGMVTAFADRESGEIVGHISPEVSEFFKTIMFLHRWFNIDNRNVGRQIIGASTFIFLLLLLSGLILWFPNLKKKNKWYNKFSFGFRYPFSTWNRIIHMNMGMYAFIFLIIIGWTGIFFTYDWVKHITIDPFKPKQEELVRQKQNKDNVDKKEAILALNFDELILDANQHLSYVGDISLLLSGKGISAITIRKTNTHNVLGAVLFDDVKYSYQGQFQEVSTFKNKPLHLKIRELIKSIHTGEILGLKSKIFNCLLALFAAYLPISAYLMWFKKMKF